MVGRFPPSPGDLECGCRGGGKKIIKQAGGDGEGRVENLDLKLPPQSKEKALGPREERI